MTLVLVVGGCRFIGYDTALTLADEDYTVWILDDWNCPGPTGRAERKPGSPRDKDTLARLIREADIVYNFYEYDGVNEARLNPGEAFEKNIRVTYNILEAFIHSRASRLIHASTAAVYGDQELLPILEDAIKRPKSWYGASKSAGEEAVLGFARERGFEAVILRYFNVYGPGEWNRGNPGVVNAFITAALTGGYIRLEGGGGQVRDFIHVADAVRASLAALNAPPGVYNVGTGRGITIAELADLVIRIHGEPVEVVIADRRPGDISASIASTAKLSKAAGWKPLIPLQYGLKKLYEYYQEKLQS